MKRWLIVGLVLVGCGGEPPTASAVPGALGHWVGTADSATVDLVLAAGPASSVRGTASLHAPDIAIGPEAIERGSIGEGLVPPITLDFLASVTPTDSNYYTLTFHSADGRTGSGLLIAPSLKLYFLDFHR